MRIDSLIQNATYPAYPPYHIGDYLEEYFCKYELQANIKTHRTFLPISWTNLYMIQNGRQKIQKIIDEKTNPSGSYYAVCVGDDVPCHNTLPKDTVVFSAGGIYQTDKTIPIPVGSNVSPMPNIQEKQKEIFASFIGSVTHPCRVEMQKIIQDDERIFKIFKPWSFNIPQNLIEAYSSVSSRSKFILAPRGNGLMSFRFYEALQYGSVPIYYSDTHYLSITDKVDYSKFSFIANKDNLKNILEEAYNMPEEKRLEMVKYGKQFYWKYCTQAGICEYIRERLENEHR